MADTPEQSGGPQKSKSWTQSVSAPRAMESDPEKEAEIRALISNMLDESVTTTQHEGKIVFKGGKPEWENISKKTETVLEALQRQGVQDKDITDKKLGKFGFQFGVITKDGMVLDGSETKKATYFPRQAMDSAIAETMSRLPEDGKVPFYVTFNTEEIPRVQEALKEFFKTEKTTAPIMGFLPLLAGQKEIPSGREYDGLRNLKSFLENDVDFVKVHCPGSQNQAMEKELNQRLKTHHALCMAVALYLAEFDNLDAAGTMILAPLVGAALGTGVALGVDAIHLKSALAQGLVFGGLLTVADAGDNFAGSIPEIVGQKKAGANTKKLLKDYGKNAAAGAAAGTVFDVIGAEVFAHGGGIWQFSGAALIALMTSLGFANNAKTRQDNNTQAYTELLRDKRLPPSAAMAELEREKTDIGKGSFSKAEKEEKLREVSKKLDKETKDYAKGMGMLETIAAKPTKNANAAMLGTPAYAFIPPGLHVGIVPLQLALLAGSETYNLAAINSVDLLMKATGHSLGDRLKRKLSAGEDVSLLDLPKTRGAVVAQRMAYALGAVGQAPTKVVIGAKNFTQSVIMRGNENAPRTRE